MSEPAPLAFGGAADRVLRERILQRAAVLTSREGWSAVTMSRLASEVGVSRQTVYNEVGGKPALAEAMVLRELAEFLAGVEAAFREQDELVDAIRAACLSVLEQAQVNPLLHAILSSTHGAESGLLPLLTTNSAALLRSAVDEVRGHLSRFEFGDDVSPEDVEATIDMVVRLVLSHVMQPGGEPARTARQIAWLVARVLRD